VKYPDAPSSWVWPIAFGCLCIGLFVTGLLFYLVPPRVQTPAPSSASCRRMREEWQAILELPVQEFQVIRHPPLVIQKLGPRVLLFRPLPSRRDVRVMSMMQVFGPPAPDTASTSTTTVPSSTTTTTQRRKRR